MRYPAFLRLVVDNSRKSEAVTSPEVASEIRRNWSGRGKRSPRRHRLTVVRSTPADVANSSSDMSRLDSHSSNLMTPNVPYAHTSDKPFCARVADDRLSGLCQYGEMKNRLRELRKKRGLTLMQVADEFGCDHGTISRHERGIREVRGVWIERYSRLYQVNPAELFELPDTRDEIEREFRELRDILPASVWRGLFAGARAMIPSDAPEEPASESDENLPARKTQ